MKQSYISYLSILNSYQLALCASCQRFGLNSTHHLIRQLPCSTALIGKQSGWGWQTFILPRYTDEHLKNVKVLKINGLRDDNFRIKTMYLFSLNAILVISESLAP